MKDFARNIAILPMFGPGPLLTATPAAVTIDRVGNAKGSFESVTFSLDVGIGTTAFSATNRVDFNLQDSDDNVTFANVTDAGLVNVSGTTGGNILSVIAVPAAETITKVGYVGNKRYLKLQPVFGGTHAGTALNVQAILGSPWIAPVT